MVGTLPKTPNCPSLFWVSRRRNLNYCYLSFSPHRWHISKPNWNDSIHALIDFANVHDGIAIVHFEIERKTTQMGWASVRQFCFCYSTYRSSGRGSRLALNNFQSCLSMAFYFHRAKKHSRWRINARTAGSRPPAPKTNTGVHPQKPSTFLSFRKWRKNKRWDHVPSLEAKISKARQKVRPMWGSNPRP